LSMAKRVLGRLRQVGGWALIVVGSLFLLVTIIPFAQGNLPAGIAGLVISMAFLWSGTWLLQRPARVNALTDRILKGGPYLQGRDLRIPYLLGTIPFSIFLLVVTALGSVLTAFFAISVFFIIPLMTWYLLTEWAAKWVLLKFIRNPNFHNLLNRFVKSHRQASECFFDNVTRSPTIWRRFLRVAIFSLALPAAIISLTNISPATTFNAFGEFLLLVVFVFSLPSLLYTVLWVYEDSGLRYYDAAGAIVDVPITKLVDFVTGIVGLTTIIRFLQLITGSLFQASSIGIGLSFTLLAPILLAVTVFQHRMEGAIVRNLRDSKIVPQKHITIT